MLTEYAAECYRRMDGVERWLIRIPIRLVERGDKVAFAPFGRWHKVVEPHIFRWRSWFDYVYLDASHSRGYVRREVT